MSRIIDLENPNATIVAPPSIRRQHMIVLEDSPPRVRKSSKTPVASQSRDPMRMKQEIIDSASGNERPSSRQRVRSNSPVYNQKSNMKQELIDVDTLTDNTAAATLVSAPTIKRDIFKRESKRVKFEDAEIIDLDLIPAAEANVMKLENDEDTGREDTGSHDDVLVVEDSDMEEIEEEEDTDVRERREAHEKELEELRYMASML